MHSRYAMSDSTHLMTRVTRDTKARLATLAHHQSITASALLKCLVDASLARTIGIESPPPDVVGPLNATGGCRFGCDRMTFCCSASVPRRVRCSLTSTYVSFLLAHLRALTPLPAAELAAFKRAVAEVGGDGIEPDARTR
jgi:hypothetical protein